MGNKCEYCTRGGNEKAVDHVTGPNEEIWFEQRNSKLSHFCLTLPVFEKVPQ